MNPANFFSNKKIFFGIGLLILILSGMLLFFILHNLRLNARIKNITADYEKANRTSGELKSSSEQKEQEAAKLKKDFEALSADRDNLRIQIKGLLVDRSLARQLEGKVEKNQEDLDFLGKKKEELTDENAKLKESVKNLDTLHEKDVKIKEELTAELVKERDVSLRRRLQQEKADLDKENAKLNDSLKKERVEVHDLEVNNSNLNKELAASKDQVTELTAKLDSLNKKFAEAERKNKGLEQKVLEQPKKYAEIARQNRVLIKQTANLHYNLGVFYTKQKEYSRAIIEFEKAVELNPSDAYSHFNLGYIYAEYIIDRPKAMEHFRHYLRLAKKEDKDVDWVKKYLLTWESWDGKQPME